MTEITLVRNAKTVKFPVQTKNVKTLLDKAVRKAKEQKWKRIIVIGEGDDGGYYFHNNMHDRIVIGMLEDIKYLMHRRFFNE